MSFVWGGLAVLMLPSPGGAAPAWLTAVMKAKPPLVPHGDRRQRRRSRSRRTSSSCARRSGRVLRGVGGNARAVARAGWSVRARSGPLAYGLAGVFGVLSGMALVGLTTSADANIALRYTLLSIAGVILGGGEFTGGRVSPVGAVIGALTLTLAGALPHLPAHLARLADRRAGRDPDPGAGAAPASIAPEAPAPMTRAVVRKPWIWSFVAAALAFAGDRRLHRRRRARGGSCRRR